MTTTSENKKFVSAFDIVLSELPERSRGIVAKRFGIGEKKPMTLQAIGDEYNITRERVRQIVQSGLKNVDSVNNDVLQEAKNDIIKHLKNSHGITTLNELLSLGGDDNDERGAISFLVEGMSEIMVVDSKKHAVVEKVVALSDFDIATWTTLHDTVKNILEQKQKVYTSDKLHKKLVDKYEVEKERLERFLAVSREIGKNPFDKWGLYNWDEITPKGVREKALLIMKEKQKPMHFREIAEAIDKYGLGKKGKKSHPQTVHNELIRDDNFVLVGRGVYTLNSDNYIGGTVKDVIKKVLENTDEPLSTQEIVDRVLKLRHVKPSTIRVNLNTVAKKMNEKYTLDRKTS